MKWLEVIGQGHTTPGERSSVVTCYDNPIAYAVIEAYPAGRFDLIDCSLNIPLAEQVSSERIDELLNGLQVNDDRWEVYTNGLCVFECKLTDREAAFVERLPDGQVQR